jgi:hypothetical protein
VTVATLWTFKTKNFAVIVDADYDEDTLDLSWDETGEVAEKIDSGEWAAYTFRARVLDRNTGAELGVDFLGASIYADPQDFRDHIGLAIKSRADGRQYGSYFMDMVATAIEEARVTYAKPRARLREMVA